jgi:hypothetical protein
MPQFISNSMIVAVSALSMGVGLYLVGQTAHKWLGLALIGIGAAIVTLYFRSKP